MFKLNRKNGVSYYTITSFEETVLVKHGFSTREGGVSDGCYSSMNFRFHCDDTRENVLKNFEIMADTLGMDYNKLVLSKQDIAPAAIAAPAIIIPSCHLCRHPFCSDRHKYKLR